MSSQIVQLLSRVEKLRAWAPYDLYPAPYCLTARKSRENVATQNSSIKSVELYLGARERLEALAERRTEADRQMERDRQRKTKTDRDGKTSPD